MNDSNTCHCHPRGDGGGNGKAGIIEVSKDELGTRLELLIFKHN